MNKKTSLFGLAAAALLVAGCSAEPSTGPDVSPSFAAGGRAMGPMTVTGETGPGALYELSIPENWNGELVVYAHGYRFREAPIELPAVGGLRDAFNAMGFGVAYSSYAENGFAVRDGVIRTRQLVGLFSSNFGRPSATYVIGHSLGGIITLMAAEQNPGLFDGAMPMCSLVAGSQVETDYIAHVRVLFDYFYPGVIPGSPVEPDDALVFDALVPGILGAIGANPLGAVQLAAVDQASIVYNSFPELVSSILVALFFNIEATNDLLDRAHGHVAFDNTETVYTGSFDDAALNAGVARFESTPDAEQLLANWYEPDGNLSIPVLTLHTTRDGLVPEFHEPLYADIVAEAGRSDLLVQRSIDRFGHCTFTPGETLAAFSDLVTWVRTGVAPTP